MIYINFLQYEKFGNNLNKLNFIHIPKNAGTSIENLANKHNIKWGRFIDKKDYPLNDNLCDYYYWHSPYFKKEPNTDYFALVRNPYDKIISEFYYIGGQNKIEGQSDIENFYVWLDDKHKLIKNNKHWNNCHILPQSNYIFDENGNKKIEHVVYMDGNMTQNLDNLFKNYGLDIDVNNLEKNNSREKKFKKTDLNRKALNQINEMYSDDFEKLNFTKLQYGVENFINQHDLDFYED